LQQAYAQYAALNQQAQNALTTNYGQARTDINQYFPQAAQALQTNYTAGLQPAQGAAASTQAGVNQLLAALGIQSPGQPAGQDIQSLLASTPGYQFQLDQGSQNVLRNRAASGSLASGGTNTDLTQFGQGLANTTYNQYIQSLLPFLGANTGTTSNVLQGFGQLGTGLANTYGQQGGALASNAQNLGSGIAGLLGNQASAAYGTQAGIGNAQAQGDLANYNASKNLWNVIGGVAGLGSNLLGGGGTGAAGTAAKSLFGAFA
jgi:hypothetical protein